MSKKQVAESRAISMENGGEERREREEEVSGFWLGRVGREVCEYMW